MISWLKRLLTRQKAPQGGSEGWRDNTGIEDWSGHTKLLAERTRLPPLACLKIQDALDEAGVDLEKIDAVWEVLGKR